MFSDLYEIWKYIRDFWSNTWSAFVDFITGAVVSLLDVLLSFFESLVSAIPVPASWSSNVNPLNSLPGQTLYILNAIGIVECLAIIAGAFGVRFLLNLIPAAFTRV